MEHDDYDYPPIVIATTDTYDLVRYHTNTGAVSHEERDYHAAADPADSGELLPGAVDHDGPDDEHDAAVDLHTADNDHQPTTPFPDDVLIALALEDV